MFAGFDAYLKDAWYWPADLLQDLLDVPSIDVLPFLIGMPLFEQSLSIPNELAYVPQLGVDYTTNMVSPQLLRPHPASTLPLTDFCLHLST